MPSQLRVQRIWYPFWGFTSRVGYILIYILLYFIPFVDIRGFILGHLLKVCRCLWILWVSLNLVSTQPHMHSHLNLNQSRYTTTAIEWTQDDAALKHWRGSCFEYIERSLTKLWYCELVDFGMNIRCDWKQERQHMCRFCGLTSPETSPSPSAWGDGRRLHHHFQRYYPLTYLFDSSVSWFHLMSSIRFALLMQWDSTSTQS